MKRFILTIAVISLCTSLFAQKKGEMAITAYADLETGISTERFNGVTSKVPLDWSTSIAAEFNYFATDHLRLSFAISPGFSVSIIGQDGEKALKAKELSLSFNPNIAYYVKLADRFYYAPEFGLGYELVAYKRKLTATASKIGHYDGFYAYVFPLCFEFRVSKLIGIAAACGEISWDNYATPDGDGRTNDFNFLLNKASLSVRFYL